MHSISGNFNNIQSIIATTIELTFDAVSSLPGFHLIELHQSIFQFLFYKIVTVKSLKLSVSYCFVVANELKHLLSVRKAFSSKYHKNSFSTMKNVAMSQLLVV